MKFFTKLTLTIYLLPMKPRIMALKAHLWDFPTRLLKTLNLINIHENKIYLDWRRRCCWRCEHAPSTLSSSIHRTLRTWWTHCSSVVRGGWPTPRPCRAPCPRLCRCPALRTTRPGTPAMRRSLSCWDSGLSQTVPWHCKTPVLSSESELDPGGAPHTGNLSPAVRLQ